MSPRWKWFLPGYVLALPHLLVGLMLALIYRCHSWRFTSGCFEAIAGTLPDGRTRIWGRPWAQTHGWLIIYDNEEHRARVSLRVHERCHVVQGFLGGPLYMIAYSVCFLVLFATQKFQDWKKAYRANPFEAMAYERQSLPNRWS